MNVHKEALEIFQKLNYNYVYHININNNLSLYTKYDNIEIIGSHHGLIIKAAKDIQHKNDETDIIESVTRNLYGYGVILDKKYRYEDNIYEVCYICPKTYKLCYKLVKKNKDGTSEDLNEKIKECSPYYAFINNKYICFACVVTAYIYQISINKFGKIETNKHGAIKFKHAYLD